MNLRFKLFFKNEYCEFIKLIFFSFYDKNKIYILKMLSEIYAKSIFRSKNYICVKK